MPWPLRTFFWSWRGRREVLNAQRAEGWNSAEHKQSIAVHSIAPRWTVIPGTSQWCYPKALCKITRVPRDKKKGIHVQQKSSWEVTEALLISWPLRWLHQLDTVVRALATWTSCQAGYKCSSACFHLVAAIFAVCCHRLVNTWSHLVQYDFHDLPFLLCYSDKQSRWNHHTKMLQPQNQNRTMWCGHNDHDKHVCNLF